MSNLLVQNIKHTNNTTSMTVDSSGQVTIRGENSATTTNLQQGLIKVWCYTPNDGASINDSFNVSSITDAATGRVEVNINNDMANANYSVGHTTYTNIDESWVSGDDQAAGVYRTRAYDGQNYQDIGFRSQVAGDLA